MSTEEKTGFERTMLWLERTFWSCIYVGAVALATSVLLSGLLYGSGNGPPHSFEAFIMGMIAYVPLIPVISAPSLIGGSIIIGIYVVVMRPDTPRALGMLAGLAVVVGLAGSGTLLALDVFAFDRPPDVDKPNTALEVLTSQLTYICIMSALASAFALEYSLRFLDPEEVKETRRETREAAARQARRQQAERARQREEQLAQEQFEAEEAAQAEALEPDASYQAQADYPEQSSAYQPPPPTPTNAPTPDTRQIGSLQRYVDDDSSR